MSEDQKDFRTPEAKKWSEDYIPPATCGSIDDIQNQLEHLRDANSQLRHVAHLYKHASEDEARRRRRLGEALSFCHERLAELLAVALAFEAWEARVIAGGDWSGECVRLTPALHEEWLQIATHRNHALAKARVQSPEVE